MSEEEKDDWDEYNQLMIAHLRESIFWLGGDEVVELLCDDWPGETEREAVTPETLACVLDRWASKRETESV